MDRNRNPNVEFRPPKKRRGRPPMAKKEPEVLEVEDEAVWIAYDTEEPDMAMLQPLMRIGQVMVNPAKAGAFSVRKGAADKIIAKLGPQYAIEGQAIVRRLAFQLEWHKNINGDIQKYLRTFLLKLPEDVTKGVLGMSIVPEGFLPNVLTPGWVYFTLPKQSTCANKAGTYLKSRLTPEATQANPNLKRGILDDSGAVEFATYRERVVDLRIVYSDSQGMARILYTAIKNGTQFGFQYIAKDIQVDDFIMSELDLLNTTRKSDIKCIKEALEAQRLVIVKLVAEIKTQQAKKELEERNLALHEKKMTKGQLLKAYPALASVAGIRDDDPIFTLVNTKDIVLNGVNLGSYSIKINPAMADIRIVHKRTPPNLTHPRLVKLDNKWKWDIDEALHQDLITSLASGRIAKAIHLVVSTLLSIDEKNPDHAKRLDEMKAYMYPPIKKAEVEL